MKHWLCSCPGCGHEWDGNRDTCDWCQSPGKLLEEKKPPDFAALIGTALKRMGVPDYRKKLH